MTEDYFLLCLVYSNSHQAMVFRLNEGQSLEFPKNEACTSLNFSFFHLSLKYKFSQEKNMVFSTINDDKELEYIFQVCHLYESRVVHMYASVRAT